jgi:hypothetical protein
LIATCYLNRTSFNREQNTMTGRMMRFSYSP